MAATRRNVSLGHARPEPNTKLRDGKEFDKDKFGNVRYHDLNSKPSDPQRKEKIKIINDQLRKIRQYKILIDHPKKFFKSDPEIKNFFANEHKNTGKYYNHVLIGFALEGEIQVEGEFNTPITSSKLSVFNKRFHPQILNARLAEAVKCYVGKMSKQKQSGIKISYLHQLYHFADAAPSTNQVALGNAIAKTEQTIERKLGDIERIRKKTKTRRN